MMFYKKALGIRAKLLYFSLCSSLFISANLKTVQPVHDATSGKPFVCVMGLPGSLSSFC